MLIPVCVQISENTSGGGGGGGGSSRRPVAYKKSVTSSRLPNISYEDAEYGNNNGGEEREERRKKEVEDLISKYAKKKDKDEVIVSASAAIFVIVHILHSSHFKCHFFHLNEFLEEKLWISGSPFQLKNGGGLAAGSSMANTNRYSSSLSYDVTEPGNDNAGHLWGTDLEPEEKRALLEYMKTL